MRSAHIEAYFRENEGENVSLVDLMRVGQCNAKQAQGTVSYLIKKAEEHRGGLLLSVVEPGQVWYYSMNTGENPTAPGAGEPSAQRKKVQGRLLVGQNEGWREAEVLEKAEEVTFRVIGTLVETQALVLRNQSGVWLARRVD